MGATQRLFRYKCDKQHRTDVPHPLGTRFDDHEEIICDRCHAPAYLVDSVVVETKERTNGKRSS